MPILFPTCPLTVTTAALGTKPTGESMNERRMLQRRSKCLNCIAKDRFLRWAFLVAVFIVFLVLLHPPVARQILDIVERVVVLPLNRGE